MAAGPLTPRGLASATVPALGCSARVPVRDRGGTRRTALPSGGRIGPAQAVAEQNGRAVSTLRRRRGGQWRSERLGGGG
eukprot:12431800-Heterocapsa_arctica.AAC.1